MSIYDLSSKKYKLYEPRTTKRITVQCTGNCSTCRWSKISREAIKEVSDKKGIDLPRDYFLGNDMEFGLYDNDSNVERIPNWYDELVENWETSTGRYGFDGDGETGEIRPKAHFCPFGLTQNTIEILDEIDQDLYYYNEDFGTELEIFARPLLDSYALGGHVHFSRSDSTRFSQEIRYNNAFIRYFAAPISLIIPEREFSKRVDRYGYGRIKNMTMLSYSGEPMRKCDVHEGLEFRALPSLLYHPEFLLEVFALLKVVGMSTESDLLKYTKPIPRNFINSWNAHRRDEYYYAFTLNSMTEIRGMPYYWLYRPIIEKLFRKIYLGLQWSIEPYNTSSIFPFYSNIVVKSDVSNVLSNIQNYITTSNISIFGNSDMNIQSIVSVLSKDKSFLSRLSENYTTNLFGSSDRRGNRPYFNFYTSGYDYTSEGLVYEYGLEEVGIADFNSSKHPEVINIYLPYSWRENMQLDKIKRLIIAIHSKALSISNKYICTNCGHMYFNGNNCDCSNCGAMLR